MTKDSCSVIDIDDDEWVEEGYYVGDQAAHDMPQESEESPQPSEGMSQSSQHAQPTIPITTSACYVPAQPRKKVKLGKNVGPPTCPDTGRMMVYRSAMEVCVWCTHNGNKHMNALITSALVLFQVLSSSS